ncbi:DUF1642 domain-containing protein [Lactococcus lactis]|uniref:DUF1642 domain-containing protein n=1 Tax=Lactococcus lactis TaxID=1358 RepID=UPI00223BDD1D|nr:DUF1642 domain-containing protein [Lactococcus lactis]MCT1181581.1 DUF1642 domain-containing protein [Lactococcus lactis]
MAKFEEEFKALTSWDWINVDLIQQILTRFGNWHSDKEFQELLDKYSNLNDHYEKEVIKSSKLESQIIGLKSQLQQQALPIVPEDVAKIIKKYNVYDLINYNLEDDECEILDEFVYKHIKTEYEKYEYIAQLVAVGYIVEKPQLFYLKNKMTKGFLYDNGLDFGECDENCKNWDIFKTKFTKAEIESMQTGSYELVPVEDGE